MYFLGAVGLSACIALAFAFAAGKRTPLTLSASAAVMLTSAGLAIALAGSGALLQSGTTVIEVPLRYHAPAGQPSFKDLLVRVDSFSVRQQCALFLAMIGGMLGKVLFDAIGASRSRRSALRIDAWAVVRPILVSPIVFAAICGMRGNEGLDLVLVCFSFQNGFMWQTILGYSTSRASPVRELGAGGG